MALTSEREAEEATKAWDEQASDRENNSTSTGSSSIKQKLHQIGEKLALVPPTQEELSERLDKAERSGNQEDISKIHMKIAASGQNASTSQEDPTV